MAKAIGVSTIYYKLCKYNMYIMYYERERERFCRERERKKKERERYIISLIAGTPRFSEKEREKTYHERAFCPSRLVVFELQSFITKRTCSLILYTNVRYRRNVERPKQAADQSSRGSR